MQITFDPLNPQEAEAVRAFLGAGAKSGYQPGDPEVIVPTSLPLPPIDTRLMQPGALPETFVMGGDSGGSALVFTPGAVGAPLVADAAASPTAPAAPQGSLPLPPSVPAAPALAPAAPEAPAAPSISAPSVDSSGLPWDERIHAANKSTVQDGKWRKKRGVDDALVTAVEAELRSRQATSVTPANVVPPPPVVAPVQTQTAMAEPPPVVAPPAPPQSAQPITFGKMMEWLAPLMTTGKIKFDEVVKAVQGAGANVLSDLSQPQHADKVQKVYEALGGQ